MQASVNVPALTAQLRRVLRGEVRFDDATRALYATDASNYRQLPIGVVIPHDAEDVVAALEMCRRYGAPLLPRGGGTSLAGQCCNVAVVLDFSKYMNRLLDLDPVAKTARVQPGLVLDELRDAAEAHHLTFAPDPSTHNHCTLGGMIGNNSCGVHSLTGGNTVDNIHELDILTYDGLRLRVGATTPEEIERIVAAGGRRAQIYAALRDLRDRYADRIRQRFPKLERRVSGFNLDQLLPENGFHVARALVGTEGTCVTVLEATTRLVPSPPGRSLLVLGYPNVSAAGNGVMAVLDQAPLAVEGIDDRLVDGMRRKGMQASDLALLPAGGAWLFVEFGGETKAEADDQARRAMAALAKLPSAPDMRVFDDPALARGAWQVRQAAPRAAARMPGEPDYYDGWEDAAVPPDVLGEYLRHFRALFDRYGYRAGIYGHFGQGCIHTRIDFDLKSPEGIRRYRAFAEDAADLVVRYGGSLSGEHGDGQARGELLPRMFGDELVAAFREFKSIWDPQGLMNPHKVVDPYRLDENLRLTQSAAGSAQTGRDAAHFAYAEDDGSFALAMERCIGIGECRRLHGGTMCPSYRATLDERHSTRGRARMLFEMLHGEPEIRGWGSTAVRDALDLCLACKACKSECPANVDLARYKAEFLAHYYQGHLRPRTAHSLGLVHQWARIASRYPTVANGLAENPILAPFLKAVAGIAPERKLPALAAAPFTTWFRQRSSNRTPGRASGSRVLLWPDTFNNYFTPGVARACVEALERLGFEVIIPDEDLCCGRPYYDYGRIDEARRALRRILRSLAPHLEDGVPIVGLEPSCIAVFRDELRGLMPKDPSAHRLADQSYVLSEFLESQAEHVTWPRLERRALVHVHCHQRALMGTSADTAILRRLGLDARVLDAGCCGMAGAFGFEREHYAVSMRIGEQGVLPAVRRAESSTIVLADGFSCREQIAHGTGRRALHLAEVIHSAIVG